MRSFEHEYAHFARCALTCFAVALLVFRSSVALAIDVDSYVAAHPAAGAFPLSTSGQSATLYVSGDDYAGVIRAVHDLQSDVEKVTGAAPRVETSPPGGERRVVLIGTLGHSPLIDGMVRTGKLNAAGVAGRWESFLIEVIDDPLPGVDQALVIAGSDKRGTIYGVYDLAYEIGVSPWYFWADVPVKRSESLFVHPVRHTEGEPAVRYRGIFLNDENPALLGWVNETFGGFNHEFYETVFELILRMKGNYLWPAMWGKAFADDDSTSAPLADEYGIVMGTTHHEPMMRAHVEWERYGHGEWNYETNPDTLRAFWREGIERMGSYESIVTVGMRGDGDEPMTQGTAIALLERIVADQRQIVAEVTGKDPSETPQIWALYKEVQDYYDEGMRVPDDVTLLFADDNWGNIRRLPELGVDRPGGYGVYYHFDYVGGPRNYKWINTNPIARIWDQMHLAFRYGADRMWIVNVGDLKPMEYPIEFFLEYAWDPNAWPAERLPEYAVQWSERQFGPEHAPAIADFLTTYTMFNGRRKPELLSPDTYSLTAYGEAERVVADYNSLAHQAKALYEMLPEESLDAYFQLVLFPIQASANLNELYYAAALNRLYAGQGRAATNEMADRVEVLFARDAELTRRYHEDLAGGKWKHMMSQTHIGYTYWQEPPIQVMPEVREIELAPEAEMGVAVEGSDTWWPAAEEPLMLPALEALGKRSRYFEVFNRGSQPFTFTASAGEPWVQVSPTSGSVETQERITVSIDWERAPEGTSRVPLTVRGPGGSSATVLAVVERPSASAKIRGFVESGGVVSMEAAHYSRAVEVAPVWWQEIPGFGRTHSGMTPFPVTVDAETPGDGSPRLEYEMYLRSSGEVRVHALLAPTLDFAGTGGLRYAVSMDDEPPEIVDIHENDSDRAWEGWVSDNVIVATSDHAVAAPGQHVLKFWMVDPGVVLQKLIVDAGGLQDSYLGPPESHYRSARVPARTGDTERTAGN